MTEKGSIRKTIALTTGILAGVIAILYSFFLFYVLHSAEQKLMDSAMDGMLERIVTYDISQGLAPRTDHLTRLYIEGDPVRPIPRSFKDMPDGYSEYTNGEDLHLFAKEIGGKRYLLVRHQGDFEDWERNLLLRGVLLFIALVVVCYFSGRWMASRILSPLEKLTEEAKLADSHLQNGKIYSEDLFKGDWPRNETGKLAATLTALTNRIRDLALRERVFSSEVSHEIRTPLMIVSTSLELLKEKGAQSPYEAKITDRALAACRRIEGLCKVFLSLARLQSGQKVELVELPELLRRLSVFWGNAARAKGLAFNLEIRSAPENSVCEILAASVFENLISNSIRYTDQGRISLILNKDSAEILDTGCGIKPEDREKIFMQGYRGQTACKEGFGLGLAITKRAADALNWEIHVGKRTGGGSRFVIDFTGNDPSK